MLRRLVEAGTRIVQMGYAGEGDPFELVNSAQAEIYNVSGDDSAEDYIPLTMAVDGRGRRDRGRSRSRRSMTGIPTGFAGLDQLTNGLHPGQMIVLAARPAMGKSNARARLRPRRAIKSNAPCIFFSLEMGAARSRCAS